MSSGSDFEEEMMAEHGGRAKGGAAKRRRPRQAVSDSDEDVSLDDEPESDWEAEEDTGRAKRPKGAVARTKGGRGRAADDDEDDAVINEEDFILDEEDRRKLEGMTELEREMVIAERAEKRQQEIQRKKLLRQADDDKPDKRAPRMKSAREVREETAKKSAIEELKAARERKTKGVRAKPSEKDHDDDEEEGALPGGEEISDMDEDDGGYPTAPYAPPRSFFTAADEEAGLEAAFDEIKAITVRRHRLEEWWTKPFFEATMVGCMVKIVLAERKDERGNPKYTRDGRPDRSYRLVQVVGVEELPPGLHKFRPGDSSSGFKSPYPFGPDAVTPKPRTHKWLRVTQGYKELLWPMAMVSNEGLTEEDFDKFQNLRRAEHCHDITQGEVKEVLERISRADTYTYTSEDVTRMIEERKAKGLAPVNLVAERARLEQEKTAATEAGDAAKLEETEARLAALDAAAAAASSRRQGTGPSMAELNRKNAVRNVKSTAKGEGAVVEGNGAGAATLDPFKRRATRSTIYWKTKQAEEGAQTEADLAAAAADAALAARANGAAARKTKIVVEDVVDLSGLDLSVLDLPPRVSAMARKLLGTLREVEARAVPAVAGPKGRVVTLEEYKRMRPPPPPPPPAY